LRPGGGNRLAAAQSLNQSAPVCIQVATSDGEIAMNRFTLLCALAVFCASPAYADIDIGHADCSLHSEYSLTINPRDLTFTRKDGPPATIVIADGSLRVDDRLLTISAADQQRLRDIEHGVRESIPEVKAIAHAAIAIAFEAVGEVAAAFAHDTESARASARRLSRTAHELDARIDSSNGFSGWQKADVDRVIGGAVESLVGEIAATVAARAVTVALSGDEKAAADLEARADGIEKTVDRLVARHSKDLDQRALGLCTRLRTLAGMEDRLELRLPDGKPLQLVRMQD
jgi:hypothetical protein